MEVGEGPIYMNLLASHSRRKQRSKGKDCNEQKLMPNHCISTAIPDIYFVMTLYKLSAWRRNTVVGSIILPIDDLNNFKNNGPVWCNLIQWNRKLRSIETTGRLLLTVLSTQTFELWKDGRENISCPNMTYLLFGNVSQPSFKAHHDHRCNEWDDQKATAPCLE
ncbi:hypothetical protein GpartN1_g6361.t1 [Galdieria partita]|uniref:Uncharacterized protein n=1 Tax=Galdieria partita TaxID=83374 RepID=A0A9C7PYG3_9RHOD|nr:hypothetical protein GpartN1_g4556.t1 [Galdieria partita]GJQ14570.1 hypothetical protein GpartN1_g6361.t1 [Galdieria partita]